MLFNIHCKDTEELFETPIVQQTAFWSEVKEQLGADTRAINFKVYQSDLFYRSMDDKTIISSDILAIIWQIDRNHSIAYIPYGPELEPSEEFQGMFLEELSESIRSFLPNDCILIRYDLCWQSYWAKDDEHFDENGVWKGQPDSLTQEFRFNFNTHRWNFKKAYFNILPSNTIYLDLQQDTDTILRKMKPKTRYNIRLSARRGVEVKSMGPEGLDIWYELYKETAARNHLLLNDISHFEAVLKAKSNHSRLPADVRLLIAEWNGKPLAAMFLVMTANRGSYLYGASSSQHRNLMATYALQWEAIQLSKANGCTEYDMFGISPSPDPAHPLYGLYRFKAGFGGEIYHNLGCWDYPLDEEKYALFRASEINSQGYHLS